FGAGDGFDGVGGGGKAFCSGREAIQKVLGLGDVHVFGLEGDHAFFAGGVDDAVGFEAFGGNHAGGAEDEGGFAAHHVVEELAADGPAPGEEHLRAILVMNYRGAGVDGGA